MDERCSRANGRLRELSERENGARAHAGAESTNTDAVAEPMKQRGRKADGKTQEQRGQ